MRVGDEIWWFQAETIELPSRKICPGRLQLVHDLVISIDEESQLITTEFATHIPMSTIWGFTRQEAWNRLKADLEKWGKLE